MNLKNSQILTFVYLKIILLGFILSQTYLAFTASFLTKRFHSNQIKTIEELRESNLKILSFEGKTNLYAFEKHEFVFNVDRGIYMEHFKTLNTSYAYLEFQDRYDVYLQQQKFLLYSRVRLTNICPLISTSTFIGTYDTLYFRYLNNFITHIHEAGFYNLWISRTFDELVAMKILQRMQDTRLHGQPLSVERLRLLWYGWFAGIILSTIRFLVERIPFELSKGRNET